MTPEYQRLLMIRFIIAVCIAGCTIAILSTGKAWTHDAMPTAAMPNGWSFDQRCCGNGDCYPVQTDAITERPDGYHIQSTGEVIPYQSTKVLPSPDGLPYRCSTAGSVQGVTYCIYMPKGGV